MTPEEQEQIVSDLEIALDRLQALYNQYFMGIEKIEPTVQRKDVERKIHLLRREQIRNTAIRFRMQTQIQKYNTQSTYWRRICRQIEEGTYKRDVMRAQRRTATVRDDRELAQRALKELDDTGQHDLERPPTHTVDMEAIGLDDPFDEGPTAVQNRPSKLDAIDDPFVDPEPLSTKPPAEPAPGFMAPVPDESFADDRDRTPVPIAGSGAHNLREKLIEETRRKTDAETEKLADFFSRRSVPPPPPPAAGGAPAPKPPPAPPPKAAGPKTAKTAGSGGVSEDRMQAIYRAYVSARKKCNERADVSYDKISNLLQKQMGANKSVKDFKVVIRDGKAVIKSVKK